MAQSTPREHFILVTFVVTMACLSVPATAQSLSTIQPAATPAPGGKPPFAIEVVDDVTGRGVPLVELKTVANVRYITDSAGIAAIDDPALAGRATYFSVTSHGYTYPADGFGFRGVRLRVRPGDVERIAVTRQNVAERLYRLTGEGIYRDSVMIGRTTPIREPLLDGEVTGQDSALAAIYRGRIHWFFGDTSRLSYPLGHFWTAGATSEVPGRGGLDPDKGVNLSYFTGPDGFSRSMLPRVDSVPCWLDGLFVLPGEDGNEHLFARSSLMKDLGQCVGRRLVLYNDEKQIFETRREIPLDQPLCPCGHPFRVTNDDGSWLYFGPCCPTVRVRADLRSVLDFDAYEGFTCLAGGSPYREGATKLDRDASGRLIWAWKRKTAPLDAEQVRRLVSTGLMKQSEAWFNPRDAQTHKPISLAMGSVAYNDYRRTWVMIACETGGSSSRLGEIWYAEAKHPEGPWPWAKKIVTHDHYSFYNPVQHPFFAQDGGRLIYFEGTYSGTFSRAGDLTPRYEYNQIMYRLALSDPRLKLPE